MKKSTVEHYKLAVKRACNAMEGIKAAHAAYERECALAKNAYEGDLLGEKGYKERLEQLAQERDARIESELGYIDKAGEEYAGEMAELGRMDGDRIDDNAVKLLNSGIQLSTDEWQTLANEFKDNYVMTRLLKDKYNSSKKPGEGLTFIRFGQSPADRKENFGKFTRTLHYACTNKHMPRNGTMDFASRQDYFNYLAKESLGRMEPFGDEDFTTVETDFPVEYVRAQSTIF